MERVKLTFEKGGDHGDRVIIRKDGGFTTRDMERLTQVVEDLFDEGGAEDSVDDQRELEEVDEENKDEEQSASSGGNGGGGDQAFMDRVEREAKKAAAAAGAGKGTDKGGPIGDTTPPAGRGQAAAKLPDGTGITKEGTVDRRTLRGTPENPDAQQQKLVKKVEKAVGRDGSGARA